VSVRRLAGTVGLAMGAAVFALYLGLWGAITASGGTDGADYTAFYTGWTIVLQGDGASLYDPATQATVQREILGGRSFEAGLNPFNNPPYLVLPFVPLALIPLQTSYAVWAVVQLGLLAWLVRRLLTQVAQGWSRNERLLLVGAALAAPPLALALFQGSLSLVVTVAMLEVYLALRRGRDSVAGLWLVGASIKPQAVLTTGVAMLAARRWRLLGVAAACLGVLALAATVVMGPSVWADYTRFLGDYVGSFDVMSVRPSVMWNVRGTLTLLIGPDVSAGQADAINTIALVAQVAILVVVAWLWRSRWDVGSPAFALRFSLTLVLGLLFSPHLNPHDGLVLVPAAAIAYGALRTRREGGWLGLAMFASPFVILLSNPLSVTEPGGPLVRTPVLLMGAFAVVLAVTLRSSSREPA
jgi:Glycosyltransferase family 87